MLAGVLQEAAWLVLAAAAVLVGIALLFLVLRGQFKSLDLKVGSMQAAIASVGDTVEKVNQAVNNVPEGMPTLVTRVTMIETEQMRQRIVLAAIALQVGVRLPTEWMHVEAAEAS